MSGEPLGAARPPTRLQSQSAKSGLANRSHRADLDDGNDGAVVAPRLASVVAADDVKDHGVVGGVEVVSMIGPATGAEVDFDATGA